MNLAKLAKRIEKAKNEGKQYVTIRYDVVKRMILKGEYARMVCKYDYTDDYYYDYINNFGKRELAPEEARRIAETELKGARCWINVDEPNVIVISIFHHTCYELYIGNPSLKKPSERMVSMDKTLEKTVIDFLTNHCGFDDVKYVSHDRELVFFEGFCRNWKEDVEIKVNLETGEVLSRGKNDMDAIENNIWYSSISLFDRILEMAKSFIHR